MQTSEGAKKAAATMQLKYGEDYYEKLARKGGKNSTSRPFKDPDKAKAAVEKRWKKARAK